MRSRQLIVLAIIAGLALVAAIWAARSRAPDSGGATGEPLVPGLEAAVNDVTQVDIGVGADQNMVGLERGKDGWTVKQKSGYPADVGKLREMLLNLADATVLERKTSDPANYSELGVGEEPDDDAAGARIEITGLDEPVRLIIGNHARGGSSTYARREDEKTALLVNGNLDVEKNPVEWLRRDILDIAADSVQSVVITQPDGAALSIAKASRGLPDFSVENIPAGQQLKSAADVSSVASALTGLRLEDVRPAQKAAAGDAVQSVYRLFDGTVVTIHAFEQEKKKLIGVGVDFDEKLAESMTAAPAEAPADSAAPEADKSEPAATGEPADAAPEKPAADTAAETERSERDANREKAARLDTRLKPWLFEVSDYKFEQLTRASADLFESTVTTKPPD